MKQSTISFQVVSSRLVDNKEDSIISIKEPEDPVSAADDFLSVIDNGLQEQTSSSNFLCHLKTKQSTFKPAMWIYLTSIKPLKSSLLKKN